MNLETSYEKYGNSSGKQIDTLSIAICGSDYNDIEEHSLEFLDEYERYALNEYDYETDFLASLTKKAAAFYLHHIERYANALKGFTEDLKDRAQTRELHEVHPLAIAIQTARERGEVDLRKEWLYGDYRNAGILQEANKRYSVHFRYDEKTDTLTADINDDTMEDWKVYGNIDRKNAKEATLYLASCIEDDAIAQKNKKDAHREENRKDYETRKRIANERDAKTEAVRIKKLQALL